MHHDKNRVNGICSIVGGFQDRICCYVAKG